MVAAQAGHSEVVEYLLVQPEIKTDVNIRDTDNHTPLILACGVKKEDLTESHTKSIHLLLAGGANVDAEDDGGYSALDVAVINNNIEAVRLLLEYRANVNHQNQDRFTPLHSACRYHLQEIATLLVQNGADISIPDGQGRTPIQLSQRYGIDLKKPNPTPDLNPEKTQQSSDHSIPSTSSSASNPPNLKPTKNDTSSSNQSPIPVISPIDVTRSLQLEMEAELASP